MASGQTQFAATEFKGCKSTGGPYSTLYSGFYDVNTISYSKFTHAYRGMIFFNAPAVAAALVGKIVDSISITITTINATRYNTSATWYFWRTNLSSMPAAATNILVGLESTKTGGTYFLEELTGVAFTKAGGAQTGVIAAGDVAQRLAAALMAGYGLGVLHWHAANGTTVYCPSTGLNHGGTSVAPVLTIQYHDAGSAQVSIGGTNRIAIPQVNVSGVFRDAVAQVNVSGVYRDCIGS